MTDPPDELVEAVDKAASALCICAERVRHAAPGTIWGIPTVYGCGMHADRGGLCRPCLLGYHEEPCARVYTADEPWPACPVCGYNATMHPNFPLPTTKVVP